MNDVFSVKVQVPDSDPPGPKPGCCLRQCAAQEARYPAGTVTLGDIQAVTVYQYLFCLLGA